MGHRAGYHPSVDIQQAEELREKAFGTRDNMTAPSRKADEVSRHSKWDRLLLFTIEWHLQEKEWE